MEEEKKFTIKIPKISAWTISTFILIIVLAVFLFFPSIILNLTGRVTETTANTLTPQQAANKVIDWISNYFKANGQDVDVTLINASDTESGVYKFTVKLSSAQGDSTETYYVSKDGKLFLPQVIDTSQKTSQQQPTQEIPKRDKPSVGLYIFSYCPAGTSALDSFASVGKLLGNKVDMKVKFFSNMHGNHELQQNEIQECIQESEPSKYWDYASNYVEEVYNKCGGSRDVDCDKNESMNLMQKVGIDAEKIMTCVKEKGETLYSNDKNDASKFNLQYSPSIVVNDVSLGSDFDRTPEGIKNLICSGFTTKPSECSQTLSGSSGSSSSRGCG